MSAYQEEQRAKAVSLLARHRQLFDGASGGGLYQRLSRAHVLDHQEKNLLEMIRADALAYFDRNRIS